MIQTISNLNNDDLKKKKKRLLLHLIQRIFINKQLKIAELSFLYLHQNYLLKK